MRVRVGFGQGGVRDVLVEVVVVEEGGVGGRRRGRILERE